MIFIFDLLGRGGGINKVGWLLQLVSVSTKLKNAIEIIDNMLENNKKVVLFSQYLNPLHLLKEKYGDKAVLFEGKMNVKERQSAVKSFQEDPNIQIFLGSIQAGGLGITLTASDVCIFLDLAWVPSIHSQAAARLHRIGQKNNVSVYYLIIKQSIEEEIYELLHRKMAVISELMNEEKILQIKSQSIFPELIKKLRTKTKKH